MKSAIFKTFFLSLCIIANTHFAFGQTASILPSAKTQFLDNNAKPLVSGTVDFYIPSTTTRKTTWQDAAETIPNTNPVVLDGGGRAIILGDGSYRQVVKDRIGNIIWDQVTSSSGSGSSSSTATGDGDLVGTIKPWAGLTAPNQYAFTYGQEVSRTTFSVLFTAITSSQAAFCTSGSPTITGLSDTTNFWVGMTVELSCVAPGFTTIISKTSSSVTMAINANVSTNINAIFFPWGNGNHSTTFNLPDFRGLIPAGNNNMGGVASSNLTVQFFGTADPNSIGGAGGAQSVILNNSNVPTLTTTNPTTTAVTTTSTSNAVVFDTGAAASAQVTGSTFGFTAVPTFGSVASTGNLPINSINTISNSGGIATAATVAAVGSGYTNGAQLITVSGGTCTVQPQFTITISGNIFTGTPVLANAGNCTIPPTNPATGTGAGGSGGTLNVSYSAQAFSRIQPTKTTNYIIKITPDVNSATASGVTSLGGMTGSIACGTGLLCTGNNISATASSIPAIAVTVESAGGGVGATSAQNTTAINNIIATASGAQGVRILFGIGTYNYLPSINVNKDFITFKGAGYGVTNLQCNPVADSTCINIKASILGDINNTMFSDISLSSPDTTFKKTMVKATAQSGLIFNNTLIGQNAAGGTLTGGTGGSIGLYVLGHQFLQSNNLDIFADNPIIIGKNPYSYVSTDHYRFANLYLIGGTTQPLIRYEPGVTIYDNVYDTVAYVRGTDGIFIDPALSYNHVSAVVAPGINYVTGDTITIAGGTCTTQPVLTVVVATAGAVITAAISNVGVCTVLPVNNVSQASSSGSGTGATFTLTNSAPVYPSLHLVNGRFEQGNTATSYSLNLGSQAASPLNTIVLDNLGLDGGRKGIFLRNATAVSLTNVAYVPAGATEALNIDASVDPVILSNVRFATTATVTNPSSNTIYAATAPTGYAFSPFTFLSPTSTNFQLPTFVTLGTAILAGSMSGGANVGSGLTLKSTTNGSPSGDFISLVATITNLGNATLANTINLGTPGAASATLNYSGSTSGNTAVKASAVASGTMVIPAPAGTDTFVGKATTDTLTNKSYDTGGTGNAFTFGASGTTTTTATCTGGGTVSAGSTINWIFKAYGKLIWAQASFTPTHTCVTSVSMPLPTGVSRMNQTLNGQQANVNLSQRGFLATSATTAECTTSSGNPCNSASPININGWYEIN